jgi:hypothetical protein
MSTASQPTRAVTDRDAVLPAPQWEWARVVVWSLILAGCVAFWVGVGVVLAAL